MRKRQSSLWLTTELSATCSRWSRNSSTSWAWETTMEQPDSTAEVVWHPDAELTRSSNLAAFMQAVGIESPGTNGYDQLVARAAADPQWFWNNVIKHMDIRFYQPYERVLDTSKGIEWAQWCVGGTTNAALNCLDRHQGAAHDAKDAVVWEGEDGTT